jgi:hypothetical protein
LSGSVKTLKGEAMSDVPWERLPEDTEETCNRSKHGWGDTDAERCAKKAVWIKRDTCGCGAVHMVLRHCDAHQVEHLAERKRSEEWAKRNLVTETLRNGIFMMRRRRDQKDN